MKTLKNWKREFDEEIRVSYTRGPIGGVCQLVENRWHRKSAADSAVNYQLAAPPRVFKILSTARIVFQLRMVVGTPNRLSIWPR